MLGGTPVVALAMGLSVAIAAAVMLAAALVAR